jgi:hypothetical protein
MRDFSIMIVTPCPYALMRSRLAVDLGFGFLALNLGFAVKASWSLGAAPARGKMGLPALPGADRKINLW